MDLHQLKVFRQAARTGSFTRSNERLHLSQSTISLHSKKLEDELGVPLFLRARRWVQLSEAGLRLLPKWPRVVGDLILGVVVIWPKYPRIGQPFPPRQSHS